MVLLLATTVRVVTELDWLAPEKKNNFAGKFRGTDETGRGGESRSIGFLLIVLSNSLHDVGLVFDSIRFRDFIRFLRVLSDSLCRPGIEERRFFLLPGRKRT